MTKKTKIVIGVVVLAGILWGAYEVAGRNSPLCDRYGGYMMADNNAASQSCVCRGLKYTVIDMAPVDGDTIKTCIGIAEVTCRKGGKTVECTQ